MSKKYYKSELGNIADYTYVNIKLTDFSGNSTKCLGVNNESLDLIVSLLRKIVIERNIFELKVAVLNKHGLKGVAAEVVGELPELSNEFGTATWGNGELLIWPDRDESDEAHTFHVSNARGFDELVRD